MLNVIMHRLEALQQSGEMGRKGLFIEGGQHHATRRGLLVICEFPVQAVNGDDPVTGDREQVRAGIAHCDTGLTAVYHWHDCGSQCASAAGRENRATEK